MADPRTGEIIDYGLVLWFPAPRSFSGEDVVEFHIHGGHSVVAGVLDALGSLAELRPAEPGEFTRRAFLNGKMDLTAVEGLADLIDAETAAQRRQALRQLSGTYGILYNKWRTDIVHALAHLEAFIDFPEDELPHDLSGSIQSTVRRLCEDISRHLDDNRRGERLREGILVTILGPPNVGKSSIINALSKRDIAIVAEEAGTTRDIVEVHLDLGGYPIILADTAGIRETENIVEKEGVRRALDHARQADLKLVVVDASNAGEFQGDTQALIDEDTIVVFNKSDLLPDAASLAKRARVFPGKSVVVSALNGTGIDNLLAEIESEVMCRMSSGETSAITRTRHRVALEDCKNSLERFLRASLPELAADDLRHAAAALGRITGRVGVDEILDVIFRDFCIGK